MLFKLVQGTYSVLEVLIEIHAFMFYKQRFWGLIDFWEKLSNGLKSILFKSNLVNSSSYKNFLNRAAIFALEARKYAAQLRKFLWLKAISYKSDLANP